MDNNITKQDIKNLIEFLKTSNKFTFGEKVKEFEKAWSEWLGIKYSILVNSGSSANFVTMKALALNNEKVIVSPLGWPSDITSIIDNGGIPEFIDINPRTLALDTNKVIDYIETNGKPKVIVLTHILGLCGLTSKLLTYIKKNNIILIEDVCESYGATINRKKLGTFGDMSVFSFYYGHHMTTIEGGMISTNNKDLAEKCFMIRDHGMIRSLDESKKKHLQKQYKELEPNFIFLTSGYNFRPTEITGIVGLSQLQRLDGKIKIRQENLTIWLDTLNPEIFKTDFHIGGNSSYALLLQLIKPNKNLWARICNYLTKNNIEFRQGFSGGGNQLRQPYLKQFNNFDKDKFKNVEHVHKFGMYLGNYPSLKRNQIITLANELNNLCQK